MAVTVADLNGDTLPLLQSADLTITVDAQLADSEQPQVMVMLEQSHGVGITTVATHVDKVRPIKLGEGRWRVAVTFPELPLHSGSYVVSAYLFDSKALVIYDEWYQYLHFRFENPTLTPGLVKLPHTWS